MSHRIRWLLASKQSAWPLCIAVCTVLDSWWWTEKLSETCRVLLQNKFEKLVHLVGFIIRIYNDTRSSKCQIYCKVMTCSWGIIFYFTHPRISAELHFGSTAHLDYRSLVILRLGLQVEQKNTKPVDRLHVMYYRPQNIHFLQNLFNMYSINFTEIRVRDVVGSNPDLQTSHSPSFFFEDNLFPSCYSTNIYFHYIDIPSVRSAPCFK